MVQSSPHELDRDARGLPLVPPLSSFIGREQEIDRIVALLNQDHVRLVTLTGPGGVGKTRLALQVADRLRPAFPDGVATVSLAPIRDHGLVLSAIAQTVGLRDTSDLPIADQLADALHDRTMLLVLDNFEQVIDVAPGIAALLVACPQLKVLVTSRFVLRVSGEHDIAVGPLDLPPTYPKLPLSSVSASPAVQLFVQRAHAASSGFTLSESNAAIVADICRSVDGLPLAIELAAARVTHLSLAAMLKRLGHSLPLLSGGARDQPARQQTMRQAIAWSYDLLTPDEQALLRRLSVFAGGFTLDAAEAIAGSNQTDILDAISSLTDKSLLRIENRRDGETRYLMLETVRQFGEGQLEAEGEADAARAAHAAHFTAFAESLALGYDGAATVEQCAMVRADQDNCRVALDWFNQRDDAAGLLRLVRPLSPYWQISGPWTEGIAWMERALAFERPPSLAQVEILLQLGASAGYQGDFVQGKARLTQARDAAVQLGALFAEYYAQMILGSHLVDQGHYEEGEAVITEALGKAKQANDPDAEIFMRAHLGVAAWGQRKVDEASRHLEAARMSGHNSRKSTPARMGCRYLGLIAAVAGNLRVAAVRFRESEDYDSYNEHTLARSLPNLMVLAVASGLREQAAQLCGATETVDRITRSVPAWPERGTYERAVARAREQLGENAFKVARSAGAAMTPDEVLHLIEDVLGIAEAPHGNGSAEPGSSASLQLTPREREVLRLLVDGHSNSEIGELLFISGRTAQTHVTNILAKFGVSTRTEAAARAVRDGLI